MKAEMGCSASKLDDEEAVQLCKDRKNFIKQVIEHRNRFASGHVAYIQSMRRVSLALLHYVVADDLHGFLSDSYTTPPFTPVEGLSPEIRAPLKFFTPTSNETVKSTVRTVNYLRSGGNQSVAVEEWPEPHQTVQLESYHPMENYGMNGFFAAQSSPVYRSSFFSSPHNRAGYQSSSPQASRWDYFWNPFSSLDQYGYPSRNSFDRIVNDDDIAGLRQVREAEGIPDLEEDIDDDHDRDHDRANAIFWGAEAKRKSPEVECKHTGVQVGDESPVSASVEVQKLQEVKELKSKGRSHSIEASEDQNTENTVELEVPNQRQVAGTSNAEETPGFTVYVNRRPASMAEVMKDMENQFVRICDCAHEISVMLEASRAQYSSASNELAAVRMLNPIALFRSTSSHSSASKFFHASSSSKGDADESSSDYSEECCMLSGSHKSTIDRLYAWEKKLYEEVKSGERVRIAYEKKCMQLRNHDINGDEPSVVDRTRAAIRDLHTRLKISIQTVESISKRIEVLRDGELHPQLLEMIQGLRRMWKTMADCHLIQKRTIDEAKLLLFSNNATAAAAATPPKPPRPAANLAAELRNWRSSFANWIDAQRSYTRALAGWASRCAPADAGETSGSRKALSPISPLRVGGEGDAACPEVVRVCVRWSRLVESVSEEMAVDGMDFFAAGMASVSAQQREAEEGALAAASAVEEVGPRVLCAGLSVAVGSLAELAVVSAEGYDAVVRRIGGEGRGVADA
ncbi:nitrate regulatory gene2 protein isoform X1 [Dendrobium catenatum]|nr:nitrate regulatory gene2 protein isoform X1 [Dendrobium catenatum]